ncbi:MAG: hypothetical protein PWR10_1537 [Halanaerobiales bacterium]|nr:hypothetical protein [Halanaerobiales bacterium]
MIYKWFGLSQKDISKLKDDDFFGKAAEAFYLQESEIENIKLGVLKAIGEIFKNVN